METKSEINKDLISDKSATRLFIAAFAQNKGAVIGLIFIVILALSGIFAPFVAPYDPVEQFREHALQPPAWMEGGSMQFILGTDDVGRDILSRIIYGARVSILNGLVIVVISSVIGVTLGLIAGYFGGILDIIISRIVDIIMSLPSLLVAIAVVAVLGPSLENAALAIGVISIPSYVRLMRIGVRVEKSKDYVTASRLVGVGNVKLMFNTILPNTLTPVAVQATLGFSSAILTMSALGFLGMGAQPPAPEWGTMLSESTRFFLSAWWTVTFPGLAILLTVLAFNFMGDGVRDALDPKLRQSN
ncbi:ABC transporter permease subunit [Psittacicella gerlachiana]|uniref:Dipeptide ABC transporter permease DppC n=1 Tax=Psittacicella gerlachiana TaxID=2028574 RepID=A0A3A1YNV8_9GAMM|nr:ABC transporter permease subunit [Psittacicella gerlachiana]RIY38919.1 dipeptide ABC transporter permease DppC [Psittacicella gerlachiana]